ncbi:MAG: thioredoxin TrxC [bacterium]|nr:thioredoxin TrxC [bacterium]
MDDSLRIVCPHCDTTNRVPAARLNDGPRCGHCKQSLFDAHPMVLTSANFAHHIDHSDIPVVVDFWAPWCGPCRMMAPVFEQAAAQLEPQVRLAKLNTEEERSMAIQYGIQGIPTLVIFKGGQEIARRAGATDLNSLIGWVRSSL